MNALQIKRLAKTALIAAILGGISSSVFHFLRSFGVFDEASKLLPTISYALIGIIILSHIINISFALSLKKKIKNDNFSDGENSVYEKNSKKMELGLLVATGTIILAIGSFGYFFSHSFIKLDNIVIDEALTSLIFVVLVFTGTFTEVLYINIQKSVQPEKSNEVERLDFNKRYISTLDEFELKKAGEASLKAGASRPMVYALMFLVGIYFNLHSDYYLGLFGFVLIDHIINGYHSQKAK